MPDPTTAPRQPSDTADAKLEGLLTQELVKNQFKKIFEAKRDSYIKFGTEGPAVTALQKTLLEWVEWAKKDEKAQKMAHLQEAIKNVDLSKINDEIKQNKIDKESDKLLKLFQAHSGLDKTGKFVLLDDSKESIPIDGKFGIITLNCLSQWYQQSGAAMPAKEKYQQFAYHIEGDEEKASAAKNARFLKLSEGHWGDRIPPQLRVFKERANEGIEDKFLAEYYKSNTDEAKFVLDKLRAEPYQIIDLPLKEAMGNIIGALAQKTKGSTARGTVISDLNSLTPKQIQAGVLINYNTKEHPDTHIGFISEVVRDPNDSQKITSIKIRSKADGEGVTVPIADVVSPVTLLIQQPAQ